MKPVYILIFIAALLSISSKNVYGQTCPNGDPQGGTAYDTTIAFPSGATTTQVKFPKFDPQSGMVTCVRLCVTITGVIDTLAMQNYAASAQTGTFTYSRTDGIVGPGIVAPLTNSANLTYDANLTAYDLIPGAGTDFYSRAHDTILNDQLCRTISDSATIAQFYGTGDSVAYDYNISVTSGTSFTHGSNSAMVLTSAFVNFRFEYCTCPAMVLPLNIDDFDVNKLPNNKIELNWSSQDDPYANYHYEAEFSRNGTKFESIGSFDKNPKAEAYKMLYALPNGESGKFYFRIKQVYSNGYVRYSNIKHVVMENSGSPKFSVYPNPSSGIVGIKFDNNSAGRFEIQIYNSQGQIVVNKAIVVGGSSYVQLGVLQGGNYWLRLTDKQSQMTCVNQLIIK
jgi:hypothetical protein